MPGREEPIETGKIYHIFNRTLDNKNIFSDKNNSYHFIDLIKYYRSTKAQISYSKLKELSTLIKENLLKQTINDRYFQVEIYVYTLMPNHFHLLLKQKKDRGIEQFIANITNALTRYFNLKNKRNGPIFQSTFKSVGIKTDEQFFHVTRYIHLNPYSSRLVDNYLELINYPWSSYKEHVLEIPNELCNKKLILKHFKTRKNYQKFVENHADDQRSLEYIKHLED